MRWAMWSVAALTSAGCQVELPATETGNPSATETGNPALDARLTPRAWSSDATRVSFDDSGTLRVDAAWVVLGDVRFVPQQWCAHPAEAEVTVDGPLVADLLSPTGIAFELAEAEYCGVRLPFEPGAMLPDAAPAGLSAGSIYVEATRTDGVQVRVISVTTEDAHLFPMTGLLPISEARSELILGFDIATWFARLDLAGTAPDASGDILIDEGHNAELLELFDGSIEDAVELFDDQDGDGEFDAEDDDPLADNNNNDGDNEQQH